MRGLRISLVAATVAVGGLLVAARPVAVSPAPADEAVVDQGPGRGGRGLGRGRGGQPRVRPVLLAWADTRNGVSQHASTSHALAIIEQLGYESGMWDTYIRTDSHIIYDQAQRTDGSPASGGPSLSNVDGIFFLVHREAPLEDQQKTELAEFIRSGKGLVAAHTGLTALSSWPEFGDIIGARFGGHPITGPGRVINEQPSFPAVKHFPAVFDFDDEFYLADGLSRDDVDVLLRLDTSDVEHDDVTPGMDYPLAWAKPYGNGRVFYSSFSHDAAMWDRRDVQLMYFEAIRWALGLTDASVEPHPMRDPEAAAAGQ